MKSVLLLPLPLILLTGLTAFAVGDERPNVILVLADDMGYGDVSAHNPQSNIPTPHHARPGPNKRRRNRYDKGQAQAMTGGEDGQLIGFRCGF